MRKLLISSVLILLSTYNYSQTWSSDVASIFYSKCATCHHQGGAGPFSLLTYNETSPMVSAISYAISQEIMPPWPPNNEYQQYVHDRALSTTEKTTVLDWITNGAPEGNPAATPPPPIFPTGSILGAGDLEVQIPTYMSKATAQSDDYVCFAMPSNLGQNRIIKSIEIVPGNREIVHHALIYLDPNGNTPTDTTGGDCGTPNSSTASLVMGYTPGSSPMTLPSSNPLKLGMPISANSQVIFAMHYPAGSYGMYDSTKVILHFYPTTETNVREVSTAPIIQNWSFNLPANQVTDVVAQYPGASGLPANISLLSVFPHMHLLGQSMKVFGVKSNNDTIPLIDVPDWDFEWQDFYFYKNIQLAPNGTIIRARATYDNTSSNINNPNSPPINVYPGLNTTDEMFLVYMHYMLYQTGDETYDIEDLMNQATNSILETELNKDGIHIYPNPFSDEVTITLNLQNTENSIRGIIYDYSGKVISSFNEDNLINGDTFTWDRTSSSGAKVKSGVYYLSININGQNSHKPLIVR